MIMVLISNNLIALMGQVGIAFCWQLYHDGIDKQYMLEDLLVAEVAGQDLGCNTYVISLRMQ